METRLAIGLAQGRCEKDARAPRAAIAKLDAQLCDIKDLGIRDGLHVFGQAPAEERDGLPSAPARRWQAAAGGAIARLRRARADSWPRSTVAAWRPARPARRRAARLDALPTGRNLTTIDPAPIPTRTAAASANAPPPRSCAATCRTTASRRAPWCIDLWASASLRTGGDDLAQALAYLGASPWDKASNRVTGIEILPLAQLDRPRIDVTLRISGLFRDIFEAQIALFDMAVRRVAELDEDDAEPARRRRRRGGAIWRASSAARPAATAPARPTRPSTAPGRRAPSWAAPISPPSPHAYGGSSDGSRTMRRLRRASPRPTRWCIRRTTASATFSTATASPISSAASPRPRRRSATKRPSSTILDTSRARPQGVAHHRRGDRPLVRGRLTNPRWIAGMLDHGHRGVAEIAQAVDALYAFAAAAQACPAHLFDAAHDALIADDATRDGHAAANPAAAAPSPPGCRISSRAVCGCRGATPCDPSCRRPRARDDREAPDERDANHP